MNPQDPAPAPAADYLRALGVPKPAPEPDAGPASSFLKPITDEGKPFVHVPASAMDDPALLGSFVKLEPFLPAMGLSVMEAPDGGAIVFDSSKVDPKAILSGSAERKRLPVEKTEGGSDAAPQAPSNPGIAAGQKPVNQERARAFEDGPASLGSQFLASMTKRAY